jgi:hypothetical protein
MKKLLILLVLLVFAATLHADFAKPIRYTWVVTSCANWNEAASAMVLANGNPNVMILPTGNREHPWVILKLVEEGAVYDPEDEPYSCEVSATVTDASGRYAVVDSCRSPMMLSVPDGRAVVISLKECSSGGGRGRAAGH